MFNKTIENLTFEDIEWLVQNGVTEDQSFEYKRETWGGTDANKKEMLKDIVSMANRYGGYIIIGVEEDGEAGKASGINHIPDAENERDRILSSLLANTQPRLQSVKIRVLTNNEINVMAISIPNSFKKPHMITFTGINQFWVRHDRQKMLMSIDEIKEAVINTVNITKDVNLFIAERKQNIIEEVNNEPFMVIGSYPVLSEKEMIDVTDSQLREYIKHSPIIRERGVNFSFTYSQPRPSFYGLSIGGGDDFRKIELHRNGYLEGRVLLSNYLEHKTAILSNQNPPENEAPVIRNWAVVEYLFSFTKQLKQIYSYYGYDGQIFIFCSLYNIKDFGLREFKESSYYGGSHDLSRWPKDRLEIDTLVFTEVDDVKIAKTFGDRIWQSFGFEKEPYFENGIFTLV